MEPQTRYDCFLSKDGKRLYYLNGKRVAKEKIPRDIVQTLVCKRRDEPGYTPTTREMREQDYFLSMPYELQKETMRYLPYEDVLELSGKPSQVQRVLQDPEYWAEQAKLPSTAFMRRGNPRFQYIHSLGPDPVVNAMQQGDIEALKYFMSVGPLKASQIRRIIGTACKKGTLPIIQYLMDTYPKYFADFHCASQAATNIRGDVLEYLEQFGYVRDNDWDDLIIYAINTNRTDVFFDYIDQVSLNEEHVRLGIITVAIVRDNVDVVDYMLNLENMELTPEVIFTIATTMGSSKVIEYLVDNYDVY